MNIRSLALGAVLGVALAANALAQVTVKDPWVRATVAQQKATGAFMQLTAARDLRLVAVSSTAYPLVELHEMTMRDNVMKMRQIPTLDLPASKTVELKPGGYHLMLMNLPAQLTVGQSVPVTLVFEDKAGKRETVEVNAPVRALATSAQPSGHDGHAGHKH